LSIVEGVSEETKSIDYKPFQDAIRKAILTSKQADIIKPLTNASTSLDCHMPNSAIIISLSNDHDALLLGIQHKAMEVWNMRECLESRFVTVCLDKTCLDVCEKDSIKNCILMPIKTTFTGYREGSFRLMMVLKHWLIVKALEVVEQVFFYDADVMLFRNPFPDTLYKRYNNDSIDYVSRQPEVMGQTEGCLGCGSYINGGILFFRNTTGVHKFYDYFFSYDAQMLNVSAGMGIAWDQEYLSKYIGTGKLDSCSLLCSRHTSHCAARKPGTMAYFNTSIFKLNDLVSYHGTCVGESKLKRNIAVYKGILQKSDKNHLVDFV